MSHQAEGRSETPATLWDVRLARVLVGPLRRTAIRPNHLTTVNLVVGQIVGVLFAVGKPGVACIAAALYMLSEVIDHMDGELARLTNRATRFGFLYDSAVDLVNKTALFLGIGLGLGHRAHGAWVIGFAVTAALANLLTTGLRMRIEQDHGVDAVALPEFGGFSVEDFNYLIGPVVWYLGVWYFFVPWGLGTIGYSMIAVRDHLRWNRARRRSSALTGDAEIKTDVLVTAVK
jgi:phosphatidylglycerophosphate synthase